jgi:hypothetical protein
MGLIHMSRTLMVQWWYLVPRCGLSVQWRHSASLLQLTDELNITVGWWLVREVSRYPQVVRNFFFKRSCKETCQYLHPGVVPLAEIQWAQLSTCSWIVSNEPRSSNQVSPRASFPGGGKLQHLPKSFAFCFIQSRSNLVWLLYQTYSASITLCLTHKAPLIRLVRKVPL